MFENVTELRSSGVETRERERERRRRNEMKEKATRRKRWKRSKIKEQRKSLMERGGWNTLW